MRNYLFLTLCASLSVFGVPTATGATTNPDKAGSPPAEWQLQNQQLLKRVRRPTPAKTPAWVNAVPDRIAETLVERHLFKDGEHWGLAKSSPD